jgi:hypothetical protein
MLFSLSKTRSTVPFTPLRSSCSPTHHRPLHHHRGAPEHHGPSFLSRPRWRSRRNPRSMVRSSRPLSLSSDLRSRARAVSLSEEVPGDQIRSLIFRSNGARSGSARSGIAVLDSDTCRQSIKPDSFLFYFTRFCSKLV